MFPRESSLKIHHVHLNLAISRRDRKEGRSTCKNKWETWKKIFFCKMISLFPRKSGLKIYQVHLCTRDIFFTCSKHENFLENDTLSEQILFHIFSA